MLRKLPPQMRTLLHKFNNFTNVLMNKIYIYIYIHTHTQYRHVYSCSLIKGRNSEEKMTMANPS